MESIFYRPTQFLPTLNENDFMHQITHSQKKYQEICPQYFSACILNIHTYISLLILHIPFQHLTSLCAVATECVSALAIDGILQMHFLQAGCLWHLLIFLFDYDYTLEEGGVEAEEENSKQLVANKLAKLAVLACARLAGMLICGNFAR